jgi:hypothetical protein
MKSVGVEVDCKGYASCKKVSASANRNDCIRWAKEQGAEIIIMIDDDISGFYKGWISDLIIPLKIDKNIPMISGRLIKPDGSFTQQMGCFAAPTGNTCLFPANDFQGKNLVCSALIAWRVEMLDGLWFDEVYQGSGYEDTDFCRQIHAKYPGQPIMITNTCRLVHANEGKGQQQHNLKNKAYYEKKWGVV